MEESCRLCLLEHRNVTDVFEYRHEIEIATIIQEICSISITKEDLFSKSICEVCLEIILKAYELRCVSLGNDQFLKENGTNYKLMIVKMENDETESEQYYESVVTEEVCLEPESDNMREEQLLEVFQCDDCPETKPTKREIEAHIKSTHAAQNVCSICNKLFSSQVILKQHMRRQHLTEEELRCSECNMTFNTTKRLERHELMHKHFEERINESGDKTFHCRNCTKSYDSCNEKLFLHIYYHRKNALDKEASPKKPLGESESFVCPHCGQIYKTKQILQQHIKRHFETGEKYSCPKCPQKFKSWSEIFYHSSVHTTERKFICDICSKAFKAKRDLRNHKIRHETKDVKNFQCSYCNVKLKSRYTLNRHILIHTGEKRFQCTYCQRAFTQKNELNKHLRSHIGENTYKCDHGKCSEAFRLLSELRIHQQVHYEKTVAK